MDARRKRQTIIASVVVVSLLLVAAIGTTAFVLIRKQQRADDVAEAARVATVFTKQVSAYRSSVQATLRDAEPENAARVKKAFEGAVAKSPELGDAPAWGETHSRTYRNAVKIEKTLKEPYAGVSDVLGEAAVGQPFITAAKTALKVELDDFVPNGTLANGAPLRDTLIPGFTKILARFDKVDVPDGQASVARKVRAALKGVIKDAKQAADELDSGRNTSINARSEYFAASAAVLTYERSLESRLTAAVAQAAARVSSDPSAGSAT